MNEHFVDIRGAIYCFATSVALTGLAFSCPKASAQEQVSDAAKENPNPKDVINKLKLAYTQLLQSSKHRAQVEQAAQLLAETNDNTHWTNYSVAAKLLQEHRDKAAIPLLLQYIVIHTERSSRHVMIPEYAKTIEFLTGRECNLGRAQAAYPVERLAPLVLQWWMDNEATLSVEPETMDDKELAAYVKTLLSEARSQGEFTRTRAERETCYVTSQTVNYGLLKKSESTQRLSGDVATKLLPLVLSASDDQPLFPYEAVWLLSDLAKMGQEVEIRKLALDPNQDRAIRLACLLGLYRAGASYPTETILHLYQNEVDFERRLILLVSMRWGGKEVLPILLSAMDDTNFEIAGAAACATVGFKSSDALVKFEKMLMVERENPFLLYNALAEYKTHEARLVLKRLLVAALDGGPNRQNVSRLLDSFETAWGVIAYNRSRSSDDVIVRARTGLEFAEEALRKRERELVQLRANVESIDVQLKLAEKILELRQAEYRRLSVLLGDEVVAATVVQEAKQELDKMRTEVELRKQQLVDAKARVELLQ
jgi:hypothetical protein